VSGGDASDGLMAGLPPGVSGKRASNAESYEDGNEARHRERGS
jgi:hypothetical protein